MNINNRVILQNMFIVKMFRSIDSKMAENNKASTSVPLCVLLSLCFHLFSLDEFSLFHSRCLREAAEEWPPDGSRSTHVDAVAQQHARLEAVPAEPPPEAATSTVYSPSRQVALLTVLSRTVVSFMTNVIWLVSANMYCCLLIADYL